MALFLRYHESAMLLDRSSPHTSAREKPKTLLRTFLRFSWIAIGVVALYSGWIVYPRWSAGQQEDKAAQQKKLEADRRTVEALGGSRFEILHFYATTGILRRGEAAQLCYGVSNAKAVRLDPPDGSVWPSFNRCLYVKPAKDTTYTLTIEDAAGQTKNATLTLQVR